MGRASFSQAIVQFSSLGVPADDGGWQAFETLEQIILDHRPTSPSEAVAMLDVIISDVSGGGRADGRDVKALRSIRAMLSASPN